MAQEADDSGITETAEGNCYVALTSATLVVTDVMDRVRSPGAGAIVLFAGNQDPTGLRPVDGCRPR